MQALSPCHNFYKVISLQPVLYKRTGYASLFTNCEEQSLRMPCSHIWQEASILMLL